MEMDAVTARESFFVAKYAFQLAQAFNLFYHHHNILTGSDPAKKKSCCNSAASSKFNLSPR